MNEYIGIIVIIVGVITTVVGVFMQKLTIKNAIFLGVFILASGFVIANIDVITKAKFGDYISLETSVENAKADANTISSIKKEMLTQKQNIDFIILDINSQKEIVDKEFADVQIWLRLNKLATQAQADDRKAYDELCSYRNDKDSEISKYAKQTVDKIIAEANQPMHTSWNVPWNEGVDPNTVSFLRACNNYEQVEQFHIRCALVDFIGKNKNYQKKEKLEFLFKVLREDNHLRVCEATCRNINNLIDQNFALLDFDEYFKWLEENEI